MEKNVSQKLPKTYLTTYYHGAKQSWQQQLEAKNMIGLQMIFKKTVKAAAAHLARPIEPPSGTISETLKFGHNVKISSTRPEPSCSIWSSGCPVPLKCILLMIRSYWKFDYSSLDPSHLARPVERPSGI